MVDAQATIRLNIDSASALAELKALEKQIQIFNKGIVQGTAQASKFQNEFATSLIHNINATGKFTASMGMVHTETEKFANALEKNQLSAREYFRYSMASTKTFGKLFGKEFSAITKTAEDRVKLLQTRHIELGRAADGAMRAVKVVPTALNYSEPITQMQLAIQKQQIFNQLLDTGTTKLLNFGKNTQWAGRQLMVGFTIPLTILGGTAVRTFRTMEEQAIRFKKVYGDMFTGADESKKALENIQALGKEFTKYGITVAETIKIAADAAAAGNAGKQLENIVEQTTKLAVLGDLSSEQAFDATIAIQNAFRLTGKELENAINFLNAVENQTVVALDDITEAIPRVASVISVLGGDIKDLAVFMAAMKEGGIQASDGANALKTSLGRLINPTKNAVNLAAELGINLRAIVDENAGDLRTIMLTFAEALKPLDDLSKARLMERVFGKFQFARMTTLFNNLGRSGTQAARAMDIARQSTESLAMLAEDELGVVADSAATKFTASMEKLKLSLVPLGEELVKLITPFVDFLGKLLEKFNDLGDGSKKIITGMLVGLGAIGPVVLMGIGLLANGIANLLKFINLLRKGYQNLTMGGKSLGLSTNYLSMQQLEALSVANNLHTAHERLTTRFGIEAGALTTLITKYREATIAASGFLGASGPKGLFIPGTASRFGAAARGARPIPMADGGLVPGTGNKDTVPAMLMPGEFVVTKEATKANAQTLKEMNKGGGTFRSKGTPAFGKMEYRSEGDPRSQTRGQSSRNVLGYVQTSALHLQTTTPAGPDGKKRYAGYTILGNQSFNELTKQDQELRKMLGGSRAEGYPMYRSEARNVVRYLEGIPQDKRTMQQKVSLATLKSEMSQYPTGRHWRDLMAQRYALAGLASEGLDPRSPQGKSLMSTLEKEFRQASASSKNTGQLTGNLHQRADRLWQQGVLSDAGRSGGSYTKMPIVKLLSIINDKNLARMQGGHGLTIPKFLKPVYSPSGQLVSILGEPVRQSSKGEIKTTRPNVVKTVARSPMAKFGAVGAVTGAVGLFGAAAAQAFQNRSSGTPAYGEQRATQAMLTPGEFVMGAKETQKFGPQLQAMNAGGVVKRTKGTPEQRSQAQQIAQMKSNDPTLTTRQALKKLQAQQIAQMKSNNPTLTTPQALKEIKELRQAIKKNTHGVDKSTKVYTKEQIARAKNIERLDKEKRKLESQQKRAAFSAKAAPKLSGIGMGAFIASGALQAAAAKSDDPKKAQNMQTAGNVLMGLGSLAMILPMLSSTVATIGIVAAAMAGSFFLLNRELNKAVKEGREIAKRTIVTAEEIKEMEQLTGNISAANIADRMRASRSGAINPVKSNFGENFIESDFGKQFMKEVGEAGVDSAALIANKLATFVQQGLIDAADAQSIAESIGRSLSDMTLTVKINAQLQSLIGINGRDLFKNPAEVSIRIMEDSRKNAIEQIQRLQEIEEKAYEGSLARRGAGRKTGGTEANVMGSIAAGATAVAGVGATIGAITFGPIGAAVGAVAGAVAGGVMAWRSYGKAQLEAAKATKNLTAATVGLNTAFINQSQDILDGYDIQHQAALENLDYLEEEALRRKTIVTSAEDLALVEEVLLNISNKRNKIESEYSQGRLDIIAKQSEAYKEIMAVFNNFNTVIQEQMVDETKTLLKEKFKGTAQAPLASALAMQTGELEDQSLTYTINTAVLSGTLGLENAVNMLTLFGKDEEKISKTFEVFLETKGVGGFDRVLTALGRMAEGEVKDDLISRLGRLGSENFEKAMPFLEMINRLPESIENVEEALQNLNISQILGAGADLEKMGVFVEELAEIKDEDLKKQFVLDFVSDKPEFAAIASNIEYFLSLDDESKKTFTSVFTTLVNLITPEQLEEEQAKLQEQANRFTATMGAAMGEGSKKIVVSQAQALRVLTDRVFKETQRYVNEEPTITLPDIEPPGEDPKGSKSREMTLQQLMELRLKGLDPAAASSLDYEQAAEILNSSLKKQKNAIRDLNTELRVKAIMTNLLKNDQQVLGDTLKATTSAIGAYISMIEETKIRPIQDQIDAFNKLSEAQSTQIEKYQKGLKDLSDKEDKINKIYDERIKAIDKVSEANERSSQRAKRQIDLASAIASGDFAAAAAAQADISSSEAAYQLEDARAALESARQEELKNLTIEINGQLFTREQIETNIKNLEEEIYQRTLLVRQEQERIAEIEKEITAEKEKQRKIQALQQIMSISEQLRSTVDPRQRQLMVAEMGFLGQSIGVSNLSNQGQFTQIGQQLGVNLSGFTNIIAESIKLSEQASLEMAVSADSVKRKSKNIEQFMNDGSLAAGNALGFLKSLSNSWSDPKSGISVQGNSVRDSMISAANAMVKGKGILDETIKSGLKSIGDAAAAAAKTVRGVPPSDKKIAFGGTVGYMGGGKVKKYAMGGNVNYKGSTEPAPVRMAVGNIVPGLGNVDRVPALLTPGEFVIRKSVAKENMGLLKALNGDVFPQINSGISSGMPEFTAVNTIQGGDSLYNNNYSINVNVAGTNASAEDIAGVVMNKIKTFNDRAMRGSRF